ncbi:hypothetical protein [Streptomyces sp. NPDC049881]|uniref:hypothetical protein n=1 Tax=Streptomyces sp. NPDC049881 TaxID=3155778 RepID=UPI0034392FE6
MSGSHHVFRQATTWVPISLALAVCTIATGVLLLWFDDSSAPPDDVCGTAVPSSSLDPLLPDGGAVRQEAGELFENVVSVCYVDIDGDPGVDIEVRSVSPETDLQHTYEAAPGAYGLELSPSEGQIGDASAVLGPAGALVLTSCPAAGGDSALLVNVRTYREREGDVDEQRRALAMFTAQFLNSYVDERC